MPAPRENVLWAELAPGILGWEQRRVFFPPASIQSWKQLRPDNFLGLLRRQRHSCPLSLCPCKCIKADTRGERGERGWGLPRPGQVWGVWLSWWGVLPPPRQWGAWENYPPRAGHSKKEMASPHLPGGWNQSPRLELLPNMCRDRDLAGAWVCPWQFGWGRDPSLDPWEWMLRDSWSSQARVTLRCQGTMQGPPQDSPHTNERIKTRMPRTRGISDQSVFSQSGNAAKRELDII